MRSLARRRLTWMVPGLTAAIILVGNGWIGGRSAWADPDVFSVGKDLVIESAGTAGGPNACRPSYGLTFRASGWDTEASKPADVTATWRLRAGSGPVLPIGSSGPPYRADHRLQLLDDSGESWFELDPVHRELSIIKGDRAGTGVPLNLVNTGQGDLTMRFRKASIANDWLIHVPAGGEGDYKLSIIRDGLFTALMIDPSGRILTGRLHPHPPANPPALGRFHVRGLVDEVQEVIEAAPEQSANLFEICSANRAATHLVVDGAGRVGIGTDHPRGRLEVDGSVVLSGAGQEENVAVEMTFFENSVHAGDVVVCPSGSAGVVRASVRPYEAGALGVATQSSLVSLGSRGAAANMTVAVAGRVRINVTNEGGPIRAGDGLVASPTPGHAMRFVWARAESKMTISELADVINHNEERRNGVVAKALEDFDGERGQIWALVAAR